MSHHTCIDLQDCSKSLAFSQLCHCHGFCFGQIKRHPDSIIDQSLHLEHLGGELNSIAHGFGAFNSPVPRLGGR
jgi:hypothetical protein